MKKLVIHGMKDPDSSQGDSFTCEINPESIKHNRTMEVTHKVVGDTSGPVTQFNSFGKETLSLDFILDGTGAIKGTTDVAKQIDHLTAVIYTFVGNIHKPNYIMIEYGGLVFRCELNSYDVDYTLFNAKGNPLRAKVSLSFTKFNEAQHNAKKGKPSSPDMTHAKTVREGDALPLMCKEVYGKVDYYLQVAEHNGLTNFRDLEIGSTIEFPPLQR